MYMIRLLFNQIGLRKLFTLKKYTRYICDGEVWAKNCITNVKNIDARDKTQRFRIFKTQIFSASLTRLFRRAYVNASLYYLRVNDVMTLRKCWRNSTSVVFGKHFATK